MIDIGDAGRGLLETSHASAFSVQAFYGSDLTLPVVPVDPAQSSLSFAATSSPQGTGTLYVPTSGNSLRPVSKRDPLAAYGQEVAINFTVGTIIIPLGRYRITDVPSTQEFKRLNPFITLGSLTQLTIADRLDFLAHDTFLALTSPVSTSAWAEIQRISPIPVVQSLPDATVPASLVYQSKLDAITQLMTLMGGEPAMTREGALTARLSNSWTLGLTPVTTVNGTVTRSDGMSNSLYNSVVVTNANNAAIIGTASITDPSNPLCVTGPLGRRVYTAQDPVATTQGALNKSAATYLARLSTQQSATVTVACLPRPDLELGDFIAVYDPMTDETINGTVDSMSFPLDSTKTMTLTLTVESD